MQMSIRFFREVFAGGLAFTIAEELFDRWVEGFWF
jgi:hypothetical protein